MSAHLTIRDQIHQWAKAGSHWKLDERVVCSNPDLDRLLEEFERPDSCARIPMDIPMHAIVGLQRQVGPPDCTWRQAALELHCKDWTVSAYDYFDSDLGDKPFPTTSTPMEAACHGGAVFIRNGAHRTIAGLVRALEIRGNDAKFKAVSCYLHPVMDEVLDWALRLHEHGRLEWYDSRSSTAAIELQREGCGRTFELLFRSASEDRQWYGIERTASKPYRLPMRDLRKVDSHRYMEDMSRRFVPVPGEILRAWRCRSWMTTALR